MIVPARSRIGAADWSIAISTPSRRSSTTLDVTRTVASSRSTRATGSAIGWRVASSSIEHTVDNGRPRASRSFHPVSASAIGLTYSTRPSTLVVITESAMEASVTCARSFSA